jgi:hypothetical protein
VARRAWSLRTFYDPSLLTVKAAEVAEALLDPSEEVRPAAGERPGAAWVIPQIRWVHEVDRLFPYGHQAPNLRSPAPTMEYALFGTDPSGRPYPHLGVNGSGPVDTMTRTELLGHRAKALRHHPLSMEMDRNRALAWRVLLGDDEHAGIQKDFATVAIGVEPRDRVRHIAQTMGAGWLETVLSWPHRFVLPFEGGPDNQAELSFLD